MKISKKSKLQKVKSKLQANKWINLVEVKSRKKFKKIYIVKSKLRTDFDLFIKQIFTYCRNLTFCFIRCNRFFGPYMYRNIDIKRYLHYQYYQIKLLSYNRKLPGNLFWNLFHLYAFCGYQMNIWSDSKPTLFSLQ